VNQGKRKFWKNDERLKRF